MGEKTGKVGRRAARHWRHDLNDHVSGDGIDGTFSSVPSEQYFFIGLYGTIGPMPRLAEHAVGVGAVSIDAKKDATMFPSLSPDETDEGVQLLAVVEEPTLDDLRMTMAEEADAMAQLTSTRVRDILKLVRLASDAAAQRLDEYHRDVSSLDSLAIYLTEIGYIPFPDHEKQIRLSQSIEAGIVARDLAEGNDVIGEGNKARRTLRRALRGRRLKLFHTIERGIKADGKLLRLSLPEEERLALSRDVWMATDARAKFLKGKRTKEHIEEKALLRAVDRGVLAIRIWGRKDELPASRIARFTMLVEEGREATSALASGNLRLVVNIAKRFIGRGPSFDDLIQEGNIGLLAAAVKFDWRLGFRFSTYATWWIRQAVQRAVTADREVPFRFNEELQALDRRIEVLGRELHRDPTQLELTFSFLEGEYPEWADKFISLSALIVRMTKANGGSEPSIKDIVHTIREDCLLQLDSEVFLRAFRAARVGVRNLMRRRTSMERVSLDEADGERDEGSLLDVLIDPNQDTPELAASPLLREEMQHALGVLTERERRVIVYRFGLGDEERGWKRGEDHTLEETGIAFQMTRERIRQIERKALRKFRHPTRSRPLRDYLT